jgi:hypothetical protein
VYVLPEAVDFEATVLSGKRIILQRKIAIVACPQAVGPRLLGTSVEIGVVIVFAAA